MNPPFVCRQPKMLCALCTIECEAVNWKLLAFGGKCVVWSTRPLLHRPPLRLQHQLCPLLLDIQEIESSNAVICSEKICLKKVFGHVAHVLANKLMHAYT